MPGAISPSIKSRCAKGKSLADSRDSKRSLLRALGAVAASLVHKEEEDLREAFHRALDVGVTAGMLREVIHTAYLFDGYPTALEGFRQLTVIAGVPNPPPSDVDYTPDSVKRWRSRGEKLCRQVYSAQFDKLTGLVREFAPELSDAMLVEGYGKVLSREGLDAKLRELVVVAILAAKNRPRQFLSHCLGALRLGATERELREIVESSVAESTPDCRARAEFYIQDAARHFVKPQ